MGSDLYLTAPPLAGLPGIRHAFFTRGEGGASGSEAGIYRGLNCGFGGEQLRPFVEELTREVEVPLVVYPNAGLPNELGGYDEAPAMTAGFIRDWAEQGWVNIVGGCCGTTPAHIGAIAEAVEGQKPRPIPEDSHRMRLSGLDPFATAA